MIEFFNAIDYRCFLLVMAIHLVILQILISSTLRDVRTVKRFLIFFIENTVEDRK